MNNFNHSPVLLNEVVSFFSDCSGLIVDATLGLGGHSLGILNNNSNVNIIGIDRDKQAISMACKRLSNFSSRFDVINSQFSLGMKKIIDRYHNISGIIADTGISSYQLDDKSRGFGFYSDCLDMRMDIDSSLTAKMIVNSYSREELHRIFVNYGEIRNPTSIVNAIVEYRKKNTINTALELSNLIEKNTKSFSKLHPATLVFQAIRIEVNDELGELSRFLDSMSNLNNTKVAIISFHSLEDKIVKDYFKLWSKSCICDADVMKCNCGNNNKKGNVCFRKPIIPSRQEIDKNIRSRSAKMRCFKFYGK